MKINFHRAAILGLLLIVGWLSLTAESKPQAGQARDPGVAKVTRILEELRENDEQGTVPNKTYQVTEEELNAYLSAQLHQQHQKAVESIVLLLKEGTFLTRVEVNVDELQFPVDDVMTGYLRLLLKGIQTLEIEGTLEAEKGLATYRVQEARLSGIPIPAQLVNYLLSSLGKKNNPPFDPTQPFEMPYGIQSFTFQPGNVIMETGEER
ncbi:MAG: hypothetical protein E2P05_02480 [Acidobacteria bacterium]|nr:MAG: hypothetical protein E2P05_02480 [Acidobacteriota bacterium]